MFKVGDRVFYPLHGVGHIQSIETHNVLGKESSYYVLCFSSGRMTAMVPVESTVDIGLRPIITMEQFDKVIEYLESGEDISCSDNWNRRYRENMERLRQGDIFEIAYVVKALRKQEAEKPLSSGEKKMLVCARQALLGELVCASGCSEEHFVRLLGE